MKTIENVAARDFKSLRHSAEDAKSYAWKYKSSWRSFLLVGVQKLRIPHPVIPPF